ncbi:MAG: hypothetical protein IKY83_03455 [Proteobacteria bacterium]|nr:hypothetical protein [Pseudomonadota bacterium]
MRRAYKILASIGMVALSTAVGLGVRHFVAVRKRRKGEDGCDVPEHNEAAEDQVQDDASDAEDAADDEAEDVADDEAEDVADDEAEDAADDETEDVADDDAEDAADDEAEDAADDEAEDDGAVSGISEDGEVVEADTEIRPDAEVAADETEA